jgi:hypothetical protein
MRFCLAGVLLCLAACAPLPESYPVPEQRLPVDGPDPEPMGAMLSFGAFRTKEHIVSGILEASADQTWRWTNDAPEVKVRLGRVENVKLVVRFALPKESHETLLPITIGYFVNDRLLDKVAYRRTGLLEFSKPVPKEYLAAGGENRIRCEISPVYIAQADKAKLGMILSEIGFEVSR